MAKKNMETENKAVDEIKNPQTDEVQGQPQQDPPKGNTRLTLSDRRAIRKAAKMEDMKAHPEKYTLGGRIKSALPFVGTAVAGIVVGFLGNAWLKEDNNDCSTINYVDMTDEVESE